MCHVACIKKMSYSLEETQFAQKNKSMYTVAPEIICTVSFIESKKNID
jgi:hypothetical protein